MSHRKSIFLIAGPAGSLFLAALLLICPALLAQTTMGSIVGAVSDPSGAVIPGVSVTVTNENTGAVRKVVTGDQGTYVASLLPVGSYTVSAEMSGFKTSNVEHIILQVNQTARIDLKLEVGTLSETVKVEGQISLIKTDQSDMGAVIESRKILELPLNGRHFIQLATLAPGTMSVNKVDGVMDAHGGGIIANGAGSNSNQVTMDGIENQDFLISRLGVRPNPDAIEEFKLMTSNYSAEYGRASGANINIVTKGGSNTFHGTAYEFLRNDALDARNFFDPVGKPLPEFKWNQFGATFGGPIRKDKTFFFGSWEALRIRQGLTIVGIVPTDKQLAGDMSGTQWDIYDPLTTRPNPANPAVNIRDKFLNNIIPASRISPEAKRAIEIYYPKAQQQIPYQPNIVLNPPQTEDQNQYMMRLDHQLSNTSSLWGRYAYNGQPRLLALNLGSGLPLCYSHLNFYQQNLVVGYNRTFGPRIVNDTRIGYNRFQQLLVANSNDKDYVSAIGIHGAVTDKYIWGPPNIYIGNLMSIGTHMYSPSRPTTNTFELVDSLAITRGAHSLKIGADVKRTQQNGIQYPIGRGMYYFGGGFTQLPGFPTTSGQSLADFLLGYPYSTYVNLGHTDNDIRVLNAGFYFQDDWGIARNLTLNLGVRYEYMPWGPSYRDRTSSWSEQKQAIILSQNDLSKTSTAVGFETTPISTLIKDYPFFKFMTRDQAGYPKSLVNSDNNNFSPRVGFAWRMFGNNKTVLRGGFGMFYEIIAGNIHWNMSSQIPYARALSFNPYVYDTPTLTLAYPFAGTAVQGLPGIGGSPTLNWIDPFQENWNITLQQRVLRHTSVEVGYVGAKGVGQNMGVDWNGSVFGSGASQPRRPHPERGSTSVGVPFGARWYNSMQAKVETRTDTLSLLASYTWAKALTVGGGGINENASGAGAGWNTFGVRQPLLDGRLSTDDWFLSFFKRPGIADMHHRLSAAYVWTLPFGKGRRLALSGPADWIVGGWELSGVTTYEAGVPLTVGGNRLKNPNNGPKTVEKWFDSSAFTLPRQITEWNPATMSPTDKALVMQFIGNAGLMNVVGPGVQMWDIGIHKNFPFKERYNIQFRTELFNAFNHANFGQPEGSGDWSPTAGRISSAATSRQIQFALRFTF